MKLHNLKISDDIPESWSQYFDYQEDLDYLNREAAKIDFRFDNLVVIGNGGSITSFKAYTICTQKDIFIIDSMDPALLKKIKKLCSKEKTIVIAISKSGNTLGVIESLMEFTEYKIIAITQAKNGVLRQIAQKMNWQIIEHPDIPGRYSGATSAGLFPVLLAGSKVEEIAEGIRSGYKYKKEAYSLAKYYFDLEKSGYSEVYISCYPWLLSNFRTLIIQLMHESVCKDGKGQTFYFSEAPESQHHTNQRFFGGRKNMIGTFIITKTWWDDKNILVPHQIENLELQGVQLKKLNNLSYLKALNLEYQGTQKTANQLNIPNVTIELEDINNQNVGELLSFWQLVAFYSAILRGVNPFDQPAVENSKKIMIEEIKKL